MWWGWFAELLLRMSDNYFLLPNYDTRLFVVPLLSFNWDSLGEMGPSTSTLNSCRWHVCCLSRPLVQFFMCEFVEVSRYMMLHRLVWRRWATRETRETILGQVSNVSLPFVVFGVDGYDTVPVAKGGLDYFILSCSRLDLLGEFMYSDDALPLRQTNGCSSLQWMLNISTTSRRLLCHLTLLGFFFFNRDRETR